MSIARQNPKTGVQRFREAEVNGTDTQTNATATATIAAVSNTTFYITSIHASYSGGGGLVQLKDGTTVIGNFSVSNTTPLNHRFENPVKLTEGNAANLVAAAGGASNVGSVAIFGYKEKTSD